MNRRIGMTTTVPVEIILAAGDIPVDLNNIFITANNPLKFIEKAEAAGYPRSTCAWIKGIYGIVAGGAANVDVVIGVTQGDCSNTHALMETLQMEGIKVLPFGYPFKRDAKTLVAEMELLARELGTNMQEAERVRKELEPVRANLALLDEMTWRDGLISGEENHRWLVSSSDFNGDPAKFARELEAFISSAKKRVKKAAPKLRLGYVGVPPVYSDLYAVFDSYGAGVVYNEIQRQFAMPGKSGNLEKQYLQYTYPYGIFPRWDDISAEIGKRSLDGLVHYTQNFCFRQIEDLILKKKSGIPVLTIEGDVPGRLDARTRARIEAFIEMLSFRKK